MLSVQCSVFQPLEDSESFFSLHFSAVVFHPIETTHLYTAGDDYNIRAWDLAKQGPSACLAVLSSHNSCVTALQISGDVLLSAGRDSVVTCWDVEKLEKKKIVPVYEVSEGRRRFWFVF